MRIILLIFLLLTPFASGALQILASSAQIGSIISLLTSDEVQILSGVNSCPHHYSLKPSDIAKIEESDLIIYIDDEFETFASIIKSKAKGKVVRISKIPNINIRNHNYHIWHDLEKVRLILKEIAPYIPNNKLDKAIMAIDELAIRKSRLLENASNPVILSGSLEYFFDDSSKDILRIFTHFHSANIFNKISAIGDRGTFFADSKDDLDSLAIQANIKITYIDSERWGDGNFINHYNQILDLLEAQK